MKYLPSRRSPILDFVLRHAAIIALALFAGVGIAVFDDYGVNTDIAHQLEVGRVSLNHIFGGEGARAAFDPERAPPLTSTLRYYGVAFEIPLAAIERALGLEDSRRVLLSRYMATHLFFLAAGFSAWLLAYRLFGSRAVALLAMLIFLLHPRLYAHSFFSSRDLPFLCMFMVALYLVHRAFRRDSVWAFALCGAGVALLANIRAIGVMPFAAVLGMLALDAIFAVRRGHGIKRVLSRAAAFSLAAVLTLYAAWPILWSYPPALTEAFQTLSAYPYHGATLFRGGWVQWPNLPWDYIPTWILVTTPPIALALAALGFLAFARLCAVRWRAALCDPDIRFGLLAVACLVLPIAAAIALNSNLYNGWRHMYFLYAPFCVLAAFGLNALASISAPRLRIGAFALAAVGIALTVVQMVSLHPYQSDYFNALVDKSRLAGRWSLDYWHLSTREALETLLETRPNERVGVLSDLHIGRHLDILPEDDRRAFYEVDEFPDFSVAIGDGGASAVWRREIYGVPVVAILDERAESEAAYRAAYARTQSRPPAASAGGFDMYDDGGGLTYVNENCEETDTLGTFEWRIIPAVPEETAGRGLESRFEFRRYGATFDGKCLMSVPLPGYEIEAIEARRWAGGEEESPLWSVSVPLEKSPAEYAAALSDLPAAPAVRAEFDIYADGDDRLIYVKSPCEKGAGAVGRFGLTVFPANVADLPQRTRAAGSEGESFYFHFHRYGAIFDGKCVAIRELPDYRISHLETGRVGDRMVPLWSVEMRFDGYYDPFRRALDALPSEPSARSAFDVYLDLNERTLTYVKSPCAEDDVRGRFFLSVFPADLSDVEEENRARGLAHNSLNFDFDEYGGAFDDKCAAIRELPDYPIAAIETGQWTSAEGHLWSARIEAGE